MGVAAAHRARAAEGARLMAKPGSPDAARLTAMAAQAADLGAAAPVSDEVREKVTLAAEMQLGLRCGGCQERIHFGFQFTRIDIGTLDGKPAADVARVAACDGEDGCNFAKEVLAAGAQVMEPVEYVWPDEHIGEAMEMARQAAAESKAPPTPAPPNGTAATD